MDSTTKKYDWFVGKSGIDRKDYQLYGVKWCVYNETHRDPEMPIRGGLIADEMGLGKTIMMIATFIANFVPRTLIVLPNILLEQWQSEIFRTTGHRAIIYHGKNKKYISVEKLRASCIVLTTYSTIAVKKTKKTDSDADAASLIHQIDWDRVVFDEAHHLRNNNSRFNGCKMLRAKIRWVISGTPIQNKRRDFFNLCSALNMPATYYSELDNLPHLLKNFVLKRSKKQVGISLPSLNIDSEIVLWKSDNERKVASDIHLALKLASKKLKFFMHARQSCILPSLLKTNIQKLIEQNVVSMSGTDDALCCSSKLDSVIQTILFRKGNGNGKLVFCHFRGEIDSIVARLKSGGIDNICTFDGRVSQSERFNRIRSNYEVIVLQIQTGCEGLNLQKNFSEIYFVSPHWNPAIEDQAVARCHRIGQIKPVNVFRFYMESFDSTIDDTSSSTLLTLDNYISLVQEDKREISSEIFPSK